MAKYLCLILGNGTPNAPFRPAIADITNLDGSKAFQWTAVIPTATSGAPIDVTCTVEATGNTALIVGNPNIVPI